MTQIPRKLMAGGVRLWSRSGTLTRAPPPMKLHVRAVRIWKRHGLTIGQPDATSNIPSIAFQDTNDPLVRIISKTRILFNTKNCSVYYELGMPITIAKSVSQKIWALVHSTFVMVT